MKKFLLSTVAAAAISAQGFASDTQVGIVNFASCMSDSKLGKQEQTNFENLKKQMGTLLEDTEKQLQEIATKFNDQEYLDGLSPEAEKELKTKFQTLNEDLQRYQNQYYQVMNQANMRVIQVMSNSISEASEKVAKTKKLGMVVNKEACFFYSTGLEVTQDVIGEMDKIFDTAETKKVAADKKAAAAETAPAQKK
jgi:outer membrane protein